MSEWQPIETAPRNGEPIDLWIVGYDDTVDFYAPLATKIKNQPKRHGRATDFMWYHNPPNQPNWYPLKGLRGFPLSPEVTPTHWMKSPSAPK